MSGSKLGYKFAQETTIHGLKDLTETNNKCIKCAWTLALVLSLMACMFQSYKIGKEYLTEPIATEVRTIVPQKFPEIVVCPKNWINVSELNKYSNISEETFRYFIGHFTPFSNPLHMKFITGEQCSKNMRMMMTDPESYKSDPDCQAMVKRLRSRYFEELGQYYYGFTELMQSVAIKPDKIVSAHTEMSLEVTSLVTIDRGQCYMVPMTRNPSEFWIRYHTVAIHLMHYPSPFPESWNMTTDELFFGEKATGVILSAGIRIPHRQNIQVLLQMSEYKSIPSKTSKCSSDSWRNHTICETMCSINDKLSQKHFVASSNAIDPMGANVANVLAVDGEVAVYTAKDAATCRDACTKPCFQKHYSVTVQKLPNNNEEGNPTTILVSYLDPFNSKQVTEFKVYSWETLICNMGGMFGLFTGASILSLVQILLFCFQENISKDKGGEIVLIS